MAFLVVCLCFYWIMLGNLESILGKVFSVFKTLRFLFCRCLKYTGLSATSRCQIAQKVEDLSLIKRSIP